MRFLPLSAVLSVLSVGAASSANPAVAVEHGVRYQLQSCRHDGPNLFCQLNLTSLHPDEYRALWYPGKSFTIDQSGNRAAASDVHAESVAPSDAEISLPGRHTILIIKFERVDKSVKTLNDLEIVGDDGSPITLKFSKVEVAPK